MDEPRHPEPPGSGRRWRLRGRVIPGTGPPTPRGHRSAHGRRSRELLPQRLGGCLMTRMIGCMECGDWFPLDPEYPHVNMCPPCHDRYPLPPRRVEQPVYVAPTPVERKARYSPPVVPRTGTGRPNVTRAVPCGTCGRLLVGDAGKTDAHGVRYCGTLCLAAVVFVPQSRKAAQPAVTPPARPTTVRAARTPRTCVGPSLDPGVMCGRPLEG